ncbi:MAG TPA: chemotaxis protein CheD [Acidobacteriaceae bacterium]|jgi:chemotaxis receptor (MCP) glutamine deamidase CheD|nr:chemotaxis protein CheD [Acidobacteriaceae bacterium]
MAEAEIRGVYVQPGESHLVRGTAILRTVLGSCVAATFWNRRLEIAALCHPMLPRCPQTGRRLSVEAARRYVDFTIHDLAAQFDALGVRRSETEVKLFGGADVLVVSDPCGRPTVGASNAKEALRMLSQEGFAVAASSLGGQAGMHIEFFTATGEVHLRRLNATGAEGWAGRANRSPRTAETAGRGARLTK